MKISIIIPCYNVEEYIDRCIDSLFRQDESIEKEIIIVDDGSKDNTLERLIKIEAAHPEEVMLIPLEENQGLSVARNIAISYATGGFLYFLDADDWIEDNTLKYYFDLYEENIDIDIIMSGSDRPTNLSDTTPSPMEEHIVYNMYDDSGRQAFLKQRRLEIGIGGKLIRRELFSENDIKFLDGYKYEDNYVCFFLFEKSKKIIISNQILYHWYINPNSITSTKQQIFDRIYIQDMLLKRLKEEPEYLVDKAIIEYNFWEKSFVETIYSMGMLDGSKCVEIIEMIKAFVDERVPDLCENDYINDIDKISHFFGAKYFWDLYKQEMIKPSDVIMLWRKFATSYEKGQE